MALNPRHALHETIFAYGVETADYPDWGATAYGTAPTPVAGTFIDPPTVVKRGNIVRGYGAGHPRSTFRRRDRREAEITGNVRIGGTVASGTGLLLTKCVQTDAGAGFKKLPDLRIWAGTSNRNSDGFVEEYGFCKCAQFAVDIREGSELAANITFWSLGFPTEVTGATTPALSAFSPSYATLAGAANPLSFVNRTSLPINGVEFADLITGVQLTYSNSLQRRNTREDIGENEPLSRAAVALVPGNIVVSGNLLLDGRISAAVAAAAGAPEAWTDIASLPLTFQDTGIGGTQTITFTIQDFVFNEEQQQGGQTNGPLLFSVPFVASNVTIT